MRSFRGPSAVVEPGSESARDTISNHEGRPSEASKALSTPGQMADYGAVDR